MSRARLAQAMTPHTSPPLIEPPQGPNASRQYAAVSEADGGGPGGALVLRGECPRVCVCLMSLARVLCAMW